MMRAMLWLRTPREAEVVVAHSAMLWLRTPREAEVVVAHSARCRGYVVAAHSARGRGCTIVRVMLCLLTPRVAEDMLCS